MFGREQGGIGCFMCHGLGHINERAKVVEDTSPFLREIQSLPSIREYNGADQLACLVLSSNSIKPAGCADLVWLIQSHFQSLRTLSLSQCELGCAGAKSIAKLLALKNIPILELDVSNNGLGDEGTAVVCDAAADSETLAVLNISKNGIGRGGIAGLSRLLSNSATLRSLDVSWNNIRGDAAHILCNGISQSMTLINLNLAWNGLGEANGCNALHDALKWSNVLKTIDLSENRVAYTGACILAKVPSRAFKFVLVYLAQLKNQALGAYHLVGGAL
jgi:Ran GTPase-activating protein (RanGAP) involved in mRNA processing and transport